MSPCYISAMLLLACTARVDSESIHHISLHRTVADRLTCMYTQVLCIEQQHGGGTKAQYNAKSYVHKHCMTVNDLAACTLAS
jgi:hypothetical protein